MDYTAIFNALQQASLFDLFRLNIAIRQQLNDPKRIQRIKKQLHVGQPVQYFDEKQNRLLDAVVIELGRTHVLVKNQHDAEHWKIPYYYLNLAQSDTDIHSTDKQPLNRNHFKVGDQVCFKNRQGHELFGEIVKLNPKTAGIQVGESKWRVDYSLLLPVIDGEVGSQQGLLEGKITDKK